MDITCLKLNPQSLQMNLQNFSSTFSFNPSKPFSFRFFTPSLHINPHANSVSNSKSGFRFCNSRRRASEPLIVLRNHRDSSVAIECEESIVKDDAFYMKRCVEIARKAIGCTSPNPMVGCVIVKDGVIVGEGFHPKAGQPHAEVFALRDAGDLAENATAYVSLEPCNHYGRTPPCTEALIAAKVKRVVVGMVDPNPIVASKGVVKLKEAGIDVTCCVEEELCKKLNEAYIHRMLTGKPFVALRYSLSINGCFSQLLGEGAHLCGGYYSQLLQEYDGIIYSSDAITLKPFPTSQEPHAKQPLQILIARSPSSLVQFSHLTPEAASQVIVFADRNTAMDPKLAQQGVETIVLDQLHLDTILDYCAKRGLCSVLLDLQGDLGGLKELLEEGLENDLLHKVVMEILPVWDETKKTVAVENLEKKVLTLKNLYSRNTGKSVVIYGYFDGPHVN